LTFGVGWMVMDAPGVPDAGRDSWTLGVTASVPIWHRKYDAIASEASREHFAAHASEDEVALKLDALLHDLWAQAVASHKTVELYEKTIIPQARQTFEADQASLMNNAVTFDRVIIIEHSASWPPQCPVFNRPLARILRQKPSPKLSA
jgi:hypothetical protein